MNQPLDTELTIGSVHDVVKQVARSEKGIFRMYTTGNKLIIIVGIILLCAFASCANSAPSTHKSTSKPSPTPKLAKTLSPTPTSTNTSSPTPTPANTPAPTATPANTSVPTPTPANTPAPAPTPAGPQNPYPPYTGTSVMNDPLTNNSQGNHWDETTVGTTSCGFSGGTYHTQVSAQGAGTCNPEAPSLVLSNLTYEISLKVTQGEFEGITFRFNQSNLTGYGFLIDTQLGSYILATANGTSTPFSIILNGLSPAIKTGLNQTNVLAVVANGINISLYINGQSIAQVNNSSYNQGQLGIFTIDNQSPADVEASNARAWAL